MTDVKILDKLYSHIMKVIVATGVAPHYTEIASELQMSVEAARESLNDLMGPWQNGRILVGSRYRYNRQFCTFQQRSDPLPHHGRR
ncbi:MAG: hypothetical protein ACJ0BC_02025 [Dehalococcoidia bacterium]